MNVKNPVEKLIGGNVTVSFEYSACNQQRAVPMGVEKTRVVQCTLHLIRMYAIQSEH